MMSGIRRIQTEVRDCVSAVWPAWLIASLLIFWGFAWSLPNNPHVDKSFHADENAAVWGVNQIHFPSFNPHLFNWGTAMLYQVYLLKLLFSLGGLIHVDEAGVILIGRLVAWLSAMGIIACLYMLCREFFDVKTSRIAAIMLAVLPGFIVNSHYFKTDIPMVFWLEAALLAGYRFMAAGKDRHLYALGLLAGYSISTKYSAATLIPAGLVCIVLSSPEVRKLRAIMIYGICIAAGFLVGTPRIVPNPREVLNTLHWVAGIGRAVSPWAVARGPAWRDYLTRIAPLSTTVPVWIAAGLGLVWLTFTRTRMMLPILTFLAAYTWLLNADNTRLMRYTTPLLPLAVIAVAGLLSEFQRAGRAGRFAAAFAAILLIAHSLVFTISYVRVMTEEDPRIQASRWIEQHIPRDVPFLVSTSHYLGAPQVQLWGYQKLDVQTDLKALQMASSPYLAVSEYVTEKYDGALTSYPEVKQFFDYANDRYTEVARFENSQHFLWADSKAGLIVTHDWLYPNPRITILQRKDDNARNSNR